MIGIAFDLLFFAVDELPATVPIALTLATLELGRRRQLRAASATSADAGDDQ